MLKYLAICLIILSLTLQSISEDSAESLENEHVPNFSKFGEIGDINDDDEASENNQEIDVTIENISPKEFIYDYVKQNKPLLLRNMVKDFQAIDKWTDEFIMSELENYDIEYEVYVEQVKKETRNFEPTLMKMKDFLKDYQEKDLNLVSSLPDFLRDDIILPNVFQCENVPDSLERIFLGFSNGDTQSVIHTDNHDTLLCVFSGYKKVVLLDSEYSSLLIDSPDNSYSSIDIDKFDVNEFNHLPFYRVDLQTGDCMYIPQNWIQQVDSFERNIALIFWFNIEKISDASAIESCSDSGTNPSWTLSEVLYDLSIDEFLNFLNERVSSGYSSLKDIKEFFANEIGFSVDDLLKFNLSGFVEDIFSLIDADSDEKISIIETRGIEEIRESIEQIYTDFHRYVEKIKSGNLAEKHDEL